MSAPSPNSFFSTLSHFKDRKCKVVFRDGGPNAPSKAFYGVLLEYDQKFQLWEGSVDQKMKDKKLVNFNHDDVSRIVMDLGGSGIA